MTLPTSALPTEALAKRFHRNWGWLLGLGIIMVVLGLIGLGMLPALTVVTALWIGALMLVGGGAQVIDAFHEKGWGGFALHLLIAVLYIVTGVLVIANPDLASVTLTLLIAAAFLAVGIVRIVMAFQLRPAPNWGILLFSGIISALLGILIFAKWPWSGFWVLGLFVAIELLSEGVAFIALALAARKLPQPAA
ncbi:HdeD family acid-resistance protein [Chelatococcus reniformis]|uniref:Membrane protein n=1 Tax=Chelatococcus reniformis TaxID=1494448 RepID=A0A916UQV5_9HYPH|nr:HdeD family acid-resistance protein [Chelatococcus reniformis]GGC82578.1 membrane protein [Chelatococcus reniformis]